MSERAPVAQTGWARALLAGLRAGGVTDVVVSPGSRSTPFLLAALREEALTLHDVIDERSAAFFALGLARAGRLPLLLCTSGSAGGHYLPAVMEAAAAGLPLVVLTADRPPELHDTGANQTTDQVGLYGRHARFFAELGAPAPGARARRGVQRRALRAATIARGPEPGPVHLNARARKPLEEAEGAPAPERAPRVFASMAAPDPAGLDAVAALLEQAARPLFAAGPAPLDRGALAGPLARLLEATGAPLFADAASQLAALALPGAELAAQTEAGRAALDADLLVQLGEAPIGRGWATLAKGRRRVVLAERGWPDPEGDAELLLRGPLGASVAGLLERVTPAPREAWAGAWRRVAEASAHARGGLEGELAAVGAVAAGLPEGGLLVLGNSLPVRAIDLAGALPAGVGVVAQRGVSGIDGLVAGAAGVARGTGRPTALLLGDVSMLHDAGSLLLARGLEVPLAIVALNNDGGRIFEQLPVHGALEAAPFEAHFAMRHGLALAPIAAAYGLEARTLAGPDALGPALAAALEAPGATFLEVPVPPGSAAAATRGLRARFEAALAEGGR
ncbi:MAG TPA: 2-succinyl-5-enolpyruvyl-6-hydroxy-3-cyclohexene-1-carboxylic-acid synthase [Polyangiaceae bacterium LLY-WYZ-15_(1-7)]|nr:2-succinyl-5-enolpyruvyl-6-hydroxy-3-cyclohexene-1-carboxylic-acid synthase [Sandaracinus sp.]HJL02849.1 2-succinyl-5-enolpyruvyl-6-hydroxy-3-cyclohexene-1-carboxylic-acid synthase [Polyangiaceae bacterium LLY-WYZ-15_(1-7)]HJL12177.1 2-succinyl-5-enolpyruvyl-6-hydroxy-3-cyclohexene-1-carboxylic-acid synthase [Polyangiaceae bacterium LLY-WYZ-15_(1-7)]